MGGAMNTAFVSQIQVPHGEDFDGALSSLRGRFDVITCDRRGRRIEVKVDGPDDPRIAEWNAEHVPAGEA